MLSSGMGTPSTLTWTTYWSSGIALSGSSKRYRKRNLDLVTWSHPDPVQVCVPGVTEDLLAVGRVSLHVAGHWQRVRHQGDPVPKPPVFRVQLNLMLLSKTWNPTSNFCSDQQNHTNILEHTLWFWSDPFGFKESKGVGSAGSNWAIMQQNNPGIIPETFQRNAPLQIV